MLETGDVLSQNLAVADFRCDSVEIFECTILLLHELSDNVGVDELAPVSVRAASSLVELLAKLGLVSRGDMFLFLKLVLSMGKRTGLPIGT